MSAAWTDVKNGWQGFKQHWVAYLALFLGLDLINQWVVIPAFRWVTTFILQAGEIPFISYQNIVRICQEHPFVIVGLVVELLVLLVAVYWQFAFLLLSVREFSAGRTSFRSLGRLSWQAVRRLRPGSLPLMFIYFILIIPFADLVFRTPLLAKVQIPAFIVDFMTRSDRLFIFFIATYIIILFFGVRWLFTLPLMVFRAQRTRTALASSWRKTARWRWVPVIGRLILVSLVATVSLGVGYVIIYGLQTGWDHLLPHSQALVPAVINLTLIQFASEIVTVGSMIVSLMIIIKAGIDDGQPAMNVDSSRHYGWSLLALVILFGGAALLNNYAYLQGQGDRRPITISHRGVAEENGVQNTIPALEKTHRLHPDYVEMDVHETRDHQFVVMHDENLKELTGVDKAPYQLTLKQLTRLTARENGHSAKVASLDQYLNAAERLHQKLLVEIKTTPHDSKGMLKRFDHQYGQRLKRDHDEVHSLDYGVVTDLKHRDPTLPVLYIQPYNLSYPNSQADGFSMEYSTLNFDFIRQAHRQHKRVYSWTVNQPSLMKQMIYDHADGVITDNLGELNQAINDYLSHQSYANRILNFILVVPAGTRLEP